MPSSPVSAPVFRFRRRRARGSGARALVRVALLVACGAVSALAPAGAQSIQVWAPPANDSLTTWAAEARARFQANRGDSASDANYRAYDLVGQMSRRLLRALGPGHLTLAHDIKPVLDSLGLDTDVATDPAQASFALVMVRNPYRFGANCVGFLYWWYRNQDLHMQGVVFRGGQEPTTRVWWTGRPEAPYEWAVLEHERGNGPARFTLLRLNSLGTSWSLAHRDAEAQMLGEPGEALFADLDRDGRPEVVQWAIARTDSLFVPCSDCPRLTIENTYVERQEGFTLQESRVLPSPYATFVTYVRLLLDNHRLEAAKLVSDADLVTRSLAAGWGVSRAPDTWRVEYGEQGERWPRSLAMRFAGPQGVRRYIVRFGQRDGRWIIQQWVEPQPVQPKPPPSSRGGAR